MQRTLLALAALAGLAVFYWLGLTTLASIVMDDGYYMVLGRAIVDGQGYRLISDALEPRCISFPPGYPLLLAGVWLVAPAFPANLWAFKGANIALALVAIVLTHRLATRTLGLPARDGWLAAATLAFGYFLSIAIDMTMSEVLFATVTLAAIAGIERLAAGPPRPWLPIAVGLAAVAPAYVRTLGVAVMAGTVLWLWLGRERRLALASGAVMALAFAPWPLYGLWAKRAGPTSWDYVTWSAERSDGFGPLQLLGFCWSHLVDILTSSAPVAVAAVARGGPFPALTGLLASAVVIAGLVRLARPRGRLIHGVLLFYMAILLPYPGEPERFVLAVAPLLIVAFVAGGTWALDARAGVPWRRKLPAVALAAAVALAGLAGARRAVAYARLPAHHDALLAPGARAVHEDQDAYFAWIRAHAERDALMLDYRPPLTWLMTGRQGLRYAEGGEPSAANRALFRARPGYVQIWPEEMYMTTHRALMDAHPERFELVFTPPHGSFRIFRMSRAW